MKTKLYHLILKIPCASVVALTILGTPSAQAANILWVSDTSPLGFSGPGSGMTDSGFVTLLQNAGHNVVRWNSPDGNATRLSAAELLAVNTNDVIIMGRAGASGQHQFPQSIDWNAGITKPLICMSPYFVRLDGGRLGWFGGGNATLPDDVPVPLSARDPNNLAVDFLFGGVVMNGTNTASPYTTILDRNTSHMLNAPVAGAVVYSTVSFAQEDNGTARSGVYSIVGFPAGTIVSTNTPLAGYRMYFSGGTREGATFPNAIPLYTGRENLTATGEDVFLRAVQLAINNGIPPVTDLLAPPGITSQPASATVLEGRPVSFSITVTGAAPRTVEWQRDIGDGVTFTNIPGAGTPFSKSQYDIPAVTAADNGAKFRVVATNPNGAVTSDVVALTMTGDAQGPTVLGSSSLDGISIAVYFSEPVVPLEAETTFNYILTDANGAAITAAVLQPGGRSVILSLDKQVAATYSINITEILDLFSNVITPVDVAGINHGFTGVDVGALNPAAGSGSALDNTSFQVTGGGLDIQGTVEQMRFAYKPVSGDFDARVRVNSIAAPNRLESVAKAILGARATADGNSISVNAFVTPAFPGDSSYGATARTATGAATTSNLVTVAYSPGAIAATYPAWLRVKRVGDVFTIYRSANGTDWTQYGTTTVAMGTTALVGTGVNSHRNGQIATATFSNFQIIQAPAQPTILNPTYAGGSFSGSFQTQNGFSYRVVYKDDLSAAAWSLLTTIPGNGGIQPFTDSTPSPNQRFYRIEILP